MWQFLAGILILMFYWWLRRCKHDWQLWQVEYGGGYVGKCKKCGKERFIRR